MWKDLEIEVDLCSDCKLRRVTKNSILGKGNREASVLILLDKISADEDEQKELLIDTNGEYLKKFFDFAKLDMKNCYLTTLTKCSSRGGMVDRECILKCQNFLIAQIALINPKYIITVGDRPTKVLLKNKADIREMVGNAYEYKGGIKVVPIYDVQYLLRASDKEKWKVVRVLEAVVDSMKKLISD